jgi:hypothetical protein
MLWHQTLGNIREKGLQVLHGKGMVEGMSNFSLDFYFCEHCVYGKQNWVRFPSSATRQKEFYSWCTMMCLDLCRFHHWENMCIISHL